MPEKIISCMSLPDATILSVPISNFADANEELADVDTEQYFPCCGKSLCRGCAHSFRESGNDEKCPFCNAEINKTDEERVADMMKRVEANDAASICLLGNFYHNGYHGLQQDQTKAMELYARAANLGYKKAHNNLAYIYHEGGNMKKAKFHDEAAAMAGHEPARYNLGCFEAQSGNIERALKHWTIGASAGHYIAMHELRRAFEHGIVSRESMDSTLAAYNMSCAEMRSEARDICIRIMAETAQL
jgi:TPR repeat protein